MALCRPVVRLLRSRNLGCLSFLARRHYNNSSDEPVGFIGLGNMGGPMAHNLMQKGHHLIVYDLVESAVQEAVRAGAQKAGSPAEVAKLTRTVVTMLPARSNVVECYEGNNGIFSTVQNDSLLIDSSTMDTAVAKQVAAKATDIGANFVDAPVSGGVGGAKKATLTFMVGGPAGAFDRAKPLLTCMGKNVVHCGPHGTGQATKICNNMLLAISMIGTSEAMQLGISLGLDPKTLASIINTASGRCWSSEVYNPCPGVVEGAPASNNYQGGFGTGLMAKDLVLALDTASSTKTPTPMGSLARQIYQLMCENGYAGKDFSSVFKFIEKKS